MAGAGVPDPFDRRASAATLGLARMGLTFTAVDAGIRADFILRAAHRAPTAPAVLTAVCDEAMRTLVASTFGVPARADDIRLCRSQDVARGARFSCVARMLLTPEDLVAAAAEVHDERDGVVVRASAGYRLV